MSALTPETPETPKFSTPLGSYKRLAVCPECFQEHPVMNMPHEWQNLVRDRLGHLGRGDVKHGERLVNSHPFREGVKFAAEIFERIKLQREDPTYQLSEWSVALVRAEMDEQRVYHHALLGYDWEVKRARTLERQEAQKKARKD